MSRLEQLFAILDTGAQFQRADAREQIRFVFYDLLLELGGIHDALQAEQIVHIEPGSVKAARIASVMRTAEALRK